MIYITQLIYIIDGQEQVFDEFESIAIPTILKYNGRLLLRVRPTESSFIERNIDSPYEIHLVEFKTQQDFDNFRKKDVFTPKRPIDKCIYTNTGNKIITAST